MAAKPIIVVGGKWAFVEFHSCFFHLLYGLAMKACSRSFETELRVLETDFKQPLKNFFQYIRPNPRPLSHLDYRLHQHQHHPPVLVFVFLFLPFSYVLPPISSRNPLLY